MEDHESVAVPERSEDSIFLALHLLSAGIGPIQKETAEAHWRWMAGEVGRAWGLSYLVQVKWVDNPNGSGQGIGVQLSTRGRRALDVYRRRMGMPPGLQDLKGGVCDSPAREDIPADFIDEWDSEGPGKG